MPPSCGATSTPSMATSVPMARNRSIQLFRLGDLGGHRRRRRHHLRHEVGDHLRLEDEVEIANPAQEQADDDCGNEKALNHVAVACSPRARANPSDPSHGRRLNCAPTWRWRQGHSSLFALCKPARTPPLSREPMLKIRGRIWTLQARYERRAKHCDRSRAPGAFQRARAALLE